MKSPPKYNVLGPFASGWLVVTNYPFRVVQLTNSEAIARAQARALNARHELAQLIQSKTQYSTNN